MVEQDDSFAFGQEGLQGLFTPLDEFFMREAIKQAKKAAEEDEVPVGAVIALENKMIARAYNQVETLKDPTAHAEMIAITQATNFLGQKWLHQCHIYVTIEPCSMCAGALVLSRIKRIYYGAADPKTGACGSVVDLAHHPQFNHRMEVYSGLLKEACTEMISDFFRNKRLQP